MILNCEPEEKYLHGQGSHLLKFRTETDSIFIRIFGFNFKFHFFLDNQEINWGILEVIKNADKSFRNEDSLKSFQIQIKHFFDSFQFKG